MKIRVISGTVYFFIWAALFALKCCIPAGWGALAFDALFLAVAVIGALELTRAMRVHTAQRVLAVSFCAACVPLFVAVQMTGNFVTGNGMYSIGIAFAAVAVLFEVYALILLILSLKNSEKFTYKNLAKSLFACIYAGVLCCVLAAVNHLSENSFAALLLIFFAVSFTDSCAYFTGRLLGKKVPLKLAPQISPNKTVIGAAGGVLGGMLGGVIAYFISYAVSIATGDTLVTTSHLHPAVIFLLFGFALAVVGQVGDLFESAVKRKCDIKDMGKIMPGHGGIMDRFDSVLFCGVATLALFAILVA